MFISHCCFTTAQGRLTAISYRQEVYPELEQGFCSPKRNPEVELVAKHSPKLNS